MTAANTEDTQSAYERDGFYIHSKSVLTPDVLARAAAGFEAVRAGRPTPARRPTRAGGIPPTPAPSPKSSSRSLPAPRFVRRSISPAWRMAAAATGAEMVQVWWVQGLVKPGTPGPAPTTVGWHQDKTYWSDWEEGSELFTAWLALSDVTRGRRADGVRARLAPLGAAARRRLLRPGPGAPAAGIRIPRRRVVAGGGGCAAARRRQPPSSAPVPWQPPECLPRPREPGDPPADGKVRAGPGTGATYLARPEICPVIFGS